MIWLRRLVEMSAWDKRKARFFPSISHISKVQLSSSSLQSQLSLQSCESTSFVIVPGLPCALLHLLFRHLQQCVTNSQPLTFALISASLTFKPKISFTLPGISEEFVSGFWLGTTDFTFSRWAGEVLLRLHQSVYPSCGLDEQRPEEEEWIDAQFWF